MQQEVLQALSNSRLAQGMTESQLSELVASSQAQLREYARGEIIFREGDVPQRLYILVSGSVRILKDTVSGRQILITEITEPGDMFGEIYLFVSRQTYDMYAEVLKPARVLTVSNAMFSLRQGSTTHISSVLQQNMLKIFAAKAYFMNNKLKVLASGSLRGKIVRYLFQQPTEEGVIHLAGSREDLAAYLAVTRPSLSRELGAMQAEKILEVAGHQVRVLDMEKFESYL